MALGLPRRSLAGPSVPSLHGRLQGSSPACPLGLATSPDMMPLPTATKVVSHLIEKLPGSVGDKAPPADVIVNIIAVLNNLVVESPMAARDIVYFDGLRKLFYIKKRRDRWELSVCSAVPAWTWGPVPLSPSSPGPAKCKRVTTSLHSQGLVGGVPRPAQSGLMAIFQPFAISSGHPTMGLPIATATFFPSGCFSPLLPEVLGTLLIAVGSSL